MDAVLGDRPLIHLVIRDLEILGEAASRISSAFQRKHPDVPWRDMIDLRNRLIHVYFDLDMDVIRQTVQRDLPELLPILRAILSQESME